MLVERIIRKLKKDPDYKWESSYSVKDICIILANRFSQIIRGLWQKPFIKSSKGLLFVGKGVKIRHGHKLKIGRNFIIDDYSMINALSLTGIIIGDNVSIGRNSTLICTGVIAQIGKGITIGNNTGINANAYLAGQGGIRIGNHVIIGPGCKIFSENHVFSDLNIIIKNQGVSRKEVVIGDDCWIGAGVTILSGVNIESGCIIAAGAVITKSFPSNCIIGGIPAKIIKMR